jgi:hypothetical protein
MRVGDDASPSTHCFRRHRANEGQHPSANSGAAAPGHATAGNAFLARYGQSLDVRFATLADSTSYAGRATLDAKAKNIRMVVENGPSSARPVSQWEIVHEAL